jgi:hypothetical protein
LYQPLSPIKRAEDNTDVIFQDITVVAYVQTLVLTTTIFVVWLFVGMGGFKEGLMNVVKKWIQGIVSGLLSND